MVKDMENHLELKQKYHMDRLLKAYLTEKKQNERNTQKIERLEHENKQLRCHFIRQEYLRLNKLEDDALRES